MDVQHAKSLFRGPMVSVATPFTPDYVLDLDALTLHRLFAEVGVPTFSA